MKKTLFYNAGVITMDGECPRASAVLVGDGKILRVGEQIPPESGMELRDLHGAVMLPGFVDAHSHITAAARRRLMVDLAPCDTRQAVLDALRDGLPREGWCMAMGYDRVALTRLDLDKVSTAVPMVCVHVSGHMAVLNTPALQALGYWGDFRVPAGGTVEKLPDGTPSGLVTENAWLSPDIQAKLPTPPEAVLQEALTQTGYWYASFGITTAQEARVTPAEYGLLRRGTLPIDVVGHALYPSAELLEGKGYENRFRMGGCKIFLDGSLQGGTAWLSDRGGPVLSDEQVTAAARDCLTHRWQLNAHCNGDAACEQFLRCYGRAVEETSIREDLRPVMVHAQTVRIDQLERMARLGMCASFFLDHVYYWGEDYRRDILGPIRAQSISPLASALTLGVPATIHQDAPVVPPDMLFSVRNAVNRRTKAGRVLGPGERVTPMQALKAVTRTAAWQLFEEDAKGSIAPGKGADLVILGDDPTDPDKLEHIPVLETIKDGVTVYRRKI